MMLFTSVILLICVGDGLSKMLDLTHRIDNETIYAPGRQKLFLTRWWTADLEYKGINSRAVINEFCSTEHGGTHLDAPSHFFYGSEGIWNVDEIPIERLIAPAVVVDITEKAKQDPDSEVLIGDLLEWEAKYGKIPDGAVILMNSGWTDLWPNESAVFGTDMTRNVSAEEQFDDFHYPGVNPDAAQWLIDNRNIYGVGVDTVSLDHGPNIMSGAVHIVLLKENIYGLEFVHNLGKIPPAGATIYVMPPKIHKASGTPVRLLAVWDEESPLQWRIAGSDVIKPVCRAITFVSIVIGIMLIS